jgi:hypothetical protein
VIKHALTVTLLGLGVGFTDHAPVRAAPLLPGVATSSPRKADDTVVKVAGPCLELPVVVNIVAFLELLRDEEFDRHCDRRDDAYYDHRHTYHERAHPTYKDGGYEQPNDLKAPPR